MDGEPLKLRFHRLVQKDVRHAMRYYEHEAGRHLAEDFYQKFMEAAKSAASHPQRYHFGPKNLRRVNLKRFPYHLLFREGTHKIFVVVVKHHERHPNFGLNRIVS